MTEEETKQSEAAAPPPPPPAPPAPRRAAAWLAILALLVAVGLSAAVWYDARQRLAAAQTELAGRLADLERQSRDASALAHQAQDTVKALQDRIATLDTQLGQARDRQRALETTYQELTRNREETELAHIEQLLDIASQQLQLAGNVRSALLALQMADASLARADRPRFMPLRRALAQDIEELKSAQTPDLPGLSARLDALAGAVDALPLGYGERSPPAGEERPAATSARDTLARLGAELWSELRGLVVLRRVESPEPPLLPPTQAYFLRENLRLRFLDARASLLTRDQAGYRADLRAARDWIGRYFDARAKRTSEALAEIDQLLGAQLAAETPSISRSLDALRELEKK